MLGKMDRKFYIKITSAKIGTYDTVIGLTSTGFDAVGKGTMKYWNDFAFSLPPVLTFEEAPIWLPKALHWRPHV